MSDYYVEISIGCVVKKNSLGPKKIFFWVPGLFLRPKENFFTKHWQKNFYTVISDIFYIPEMTF